MVVISRLFLSVILSSVTAGTTAAMAATGEEIASTSFNLVAATGKQGNLAAFFGDETGPSQRFRLSHVSDWVDIVVLQPGERFPLQPATVGESQAAITWRARGGKLAYGDQIAVWTAPLEAGAYPLKGAGLIAGQRVERQLTMLVTVPASRVSGGKLNGYPIGTYPRGFASKTTLTASRGARADRYTVPSGFIELSAGTADVRVSQHYNLKDFQGKDNAVGGRKYLFLDSRLVEKLERLIVALDAQPHRQKKIPLMSAYRSPYLNRAIGNTTSLSRHTYGDAADMIVQDLNRDGRTDGKDARLLFAAVAKLDHETDLIGGGAIYPPNGAHGYFVHTDTRGSIARW